MPRSANRSAENEPEPIKQEERLERPVVHHEPKSAHTRATRRHSDERPPKKTIVKYAVAAIAASVAIALVAWLVMTAVSTKTTGIDPNKYQAVFFQNGQVYFGKLKPHGSGYWRMTDVYYLLADDNQEDATNAQAVETNQNATLRHLGDTIYGPEDELIISEEQVLYYNNLRPDSKVTQSIVKYKADKK